MNTLEELRDELCLCAPPPALAQTIFLWLISAFTFAACFEIGRRVDDFLLFQFLAGTFLFFFAQRMIKNLRKFKGTINREKCQTLFAGKDPLLLAVLQSQLSLLAKESVLPLQAGGIMILGYVLFPSLNLSANAILSFAPALLLGIVYFIISLLEERITQRDKWMQSAGMLREYLAEKNVGKQH